MTRSSELARIALLRGILERGAPGVRVGIGDDAAVLDVREGGLVWTIDAQVDGTHFRLAWASWEDVGFRSYMAAASDLAAMGAEPLAALSSLVLADDVGDEALGAFARGQAAAADAVGAPVVGGNLARGTETSITTTLLGRASSPVLRSGARVGDAVYLAGQVGLAAAGLAALAANVQDTRIDAALTAWRRPRARIDDGRTMASVAHAAIDVSDGLARDASHVAEASGVRVVLEAEAILAHGGDALAGAAAALGRSALELALHGGEDYAIVAFADAPIPGFSRIGRVEPGDEGLMLAASGSVTALEPRGYDHFAKGF
jgi:thiamine-monophosphate kinase